ATRFRWQAPPGITRLTPVRGQASLPPCPNRMRPTALALLLLTLCAVPATQLRAQDPAAGMEPELAGESAATRQLEPFLATYEAYYRGRPAGSATMLLVRETPPRWRIDLDLRAERGVASLARLNIHQSTVFDEHDGHYRP